MKILNRPVTGSAEYYKLWTEDNFMNYAKRILMGYIPIRKKAYGESAEDFIWYIEWRDID